MSFELGAVIGTVVAFVIQLMIVAYLYGRLTERVNAQGEWLARLEGAGHDNFVKLNQTIQDLRNEMNTQMAQLRTQLYEWQIRRPTPE